MVKSQGPFLLIDCSTVSIGMTPPCMKSPVKQVDVLPSKNQALYVSSTANPLLFNVLLIGIT